MLIPTKTAFLFPGQGSQFVGMGKALAEEYHVARQTFAEADSILGFALSELCFDGPADDLNDTANAQPALYVAGVAALRVIYEAWDTDFRPAFTAGHSLGEFTALTAAGALPFPEGLRLVRTRGELMRAAGETAPGGMAALLGATVEQARTLCERAQAETETPLVIANDNCPGQVVVSGDNKAVDWAVEHASDFGAKRVIRLNVSVATHSPLMAPAQTDLNAALDDTPFHPAQIPVIGNTTATPITTVEEIRAELRSQLTSAVRWTDTIQHMLDQGVTHFIEIGGGNVLCGLLRRIDRQATSLAVDSPEGITALHELSE